MSETDAPVPRASRSRRSADRTDETLGPDESDPTLFQGVSTAVAVPEGPRTKVKVVQSHTLHRDNGTAVTYTADGTNCDGLPGEYEMPDVDANHWFVRAHLEDPGPPMIPPMIGSPAHIEQLAAAASRQAAINAVAEQEEQAAVAGLRDQRLERARRALGPAIEKTDPN